MFVERCPMCGVHGKVWNKEPEVFKCPNCLTFYSKFGLLLSEEGQGTGHQQHGQQGCDPHNARRNLPQQGRIRPQSQGEKAAHQHEEEQQAARREERDARRDGLLPRS